MEEGILQRLSDMLSKVEYGGRDSVFKHMKTCPCCGVFAPDQFGTTGIHKSNCELANIKELMVNLLRQTDLDIHRDNMWYGLDTGEVGFNGHLISRGISNKSDGNYHVNHIITTED